MNKGKSWGADYIRLAHGIEKYLGSKFSEIRGDAPFVDSYYGPNEFKISDLKQNELIGFCNEIIESIPDEDELRFEYLSSQLQAMKAVIGIINEEEISYLDRVERIFGIRPEFVDIDEFSMQQRKFIKHVIEKSLVPKKDLESASNKILQYCEEVTREKLDFLPIPEGEVKINVVENKSWGAYNWYDGGLISRIEINRDRRVPYMRLIRAIAHETFPGHHLEHSMKENELYNKQGFLDASIILTLAPESIISEGIAMNAWKIVFEDFEKVLNFSDENFGTDYDDIGIDNTTDMFELLEKRKLAFANPSIMMHEYGEKDEEIIKYRMGYLGAEEDRARELGFIRSPIWRYYIFYGYGEDLIEKALGREKVLKTLYTRQLTPKTLRRFI